MKKTILLLLMCCFAAFPGTAQEKRIDYKNWNNEERVSGSLDAGTSIHIDNLTADQAAALKAASQMKREPFSQESMERWELPLDQLEQAIQYENSRLTISVGYYMPNAGDAVTF